ncbi:hypothetical protein [Campylobacter volucris]|uniref:hypothetical protein n=1 Tax=Campylobacter volucris TaxID=1031542 RepID=UPI001059A0CB|nr:hypothetical protein [Campylobacter volucris]TDJ80628.1 hypothetical protein E2O25_05220 [Campylobacter volucris]
MNISNFCELINAKILNYGATSSVYDFSIDLNHIKPASVFFARNIEQIDYAIKLGAYVIVSKENTIINDKEVFYLQVDDLEEAIFRFFRFLIQEKSCKFLFCSSVELKFAQAFGFKILQGDVFLDFYALKNSKENILFCLDDENYILKLSPNYLSLQKNPYEILGKKSLFYTSLLCKNLYFKDLKFAFFYADIFASYIRFIEDHQFHFSFNDKKLELFDAYFLDNKNQICAFGTSSRVILLVEDEKHFSFIADKIQNLKEFKIALKNSLFCDFSYANLEDLKKNMNFKYCLINENKEEFLNVFLPKDKDYSLFD